MSRFVCLFDRRGLTLVLFGLSASATRRLTARCAYTLSRKECIRVNRAQYLSLSCPQLSVTDLCGYRPSASVEASVVMQVSQLLACTGAFHSYPTKKTAIRMHASTQTQINDDVSDVPTTGARFVCVIVCFAPALSLTLTHPTRLWHNHCM